MNGAPASVLRRRNVRLMAGLAGIVLGMTAMSFAAVPLYDLFCRVTGYGGTTQRAEGPAVRIGDRRVKVQFDARVNAGMPWQFRPMQREITLRVGEQGMAFYEAVNRTAGPVTGISTFNVTPAKAGQYFNKIDCFCFTEQTLAPGQRVEMPVVFFVDPALADDPATRDVKTITLSYTFFRSLDDIPKPGGAGDEVADAGAASDSSIKTVAGDTTHE
ncbi:MAG: cytochrome c oxidase assembly protein [Acetobacterales bacterium]